MAEEENTLVPLEQYLTAGIHVGTKLKTKDMGKFIYKINPNGLSVLNVQMIDQRLKLAAKFLTKYNPEDILVICRRENGRKALKQFAKLTGMKFYAGRYPAGVMTNPELEHFVEPKLVFIADPWPDKNAANDSLSSGIPIMSLVDSNNTLNNVDFAVPCNNKGAKSLALIYWILANEILKEKGIIPKDKTIDVPIEEFLQE